MLSVEWTLMIVVLLDAVVSCVYRPLRACVCVECS